MNGAPQRGTLAVDLRFIRAGLPLCTPRAAAGLLDAAIARAEREGTQAEIWHGEAAQREAAVARIEAVRAELGRLGRLLAPQDAGGRRVLKQIRDALDQAT